MIYVMHTEIGEDFMIKNEASSGRHNISSNFEWIKARRSMLDVAFSGTLRECVILDNYEEITLVERYANLSKMLMKQYAYRSFAAYLNELKAIRPDFTDTNSTLYSEVDSDNDSLLSNEAKESCAYFKNIYTDLAYSRFSQASIISKAFYHSTFASACEDVASGIAEYCIMPVYSSLDGDILSFYKLADRYDLKITYQCQLQSKDDESTTNYALFSKRLSFENNGSNILELTIDIPISAPMPELLDSLSLLGATVNKLSYMPTGYSSDYMRVKLALSVTDSSLPTIIEYFYAVGINYDILGIYRII